MLALRTLALPPAQPHVKAQADADAALCIFIDQLKPEAFVQRGIYVKAILP